MSKCPREPSPAASRENYPLPPEPSAGTVTERLRAVAEFLRWGLPLCQSHTVEFYTTGLWEKFVALPPETVLGELSGDRLQRLLLEEPTPQRPLEDVADNPGFYNIFCKNTQRLINVQAFVLAAKYYSMPNLGVCTSLEQILKAMDRKQQSKVEMKTDNFMNDKKSHEVKLMSDLVDGIAKYYGLNQVIDLGSGKGYLSSFLSLQYNLKVYGIDSSNTNTHGANERNRKLKKHWTAYQRRAEANVRDQILKETKKSAEQDKEKYNTSTSEKWLRTNKTLQSQVHVPVSDAVGIESAEISPDPNIGITKNQYELKPEVRVQLIENNIPENVFLDILPTDAIEVDCSSRRNCRELCEEEKEQRKVASLKAKASRSKEANIFSPLTSFITAETELRDIVGDLQDCILVGLHTCGDLAPSTLKLFNAVPEIKAVCSVGCCYHLLSEEHEMHEEGTRGIWGFPLGRYLKEEGWFCGRNARMAACLALERVAVGQMLPTESLFYRAVLQVIVEECYGIKRSDRNIGKVYSKSSSFLDYVRISLKKLELDESKISDSLVLEYLEKYKHRMNELEAFNMLKVVLGPCIEVLILLDRLCYLKEQDNIAWSGLVKLFDPIKSPRCYAVVALKK
ncbi:probable methyltransferase-like protein 25 [Ahaetulla prasina]|uniref:probable methyltransferase-like protein 25 n=1 Tax=Ahaetulla prasina TaxID=499056 RepID=UPI002647D1CB|nr:probable methyltransferase-like protein 25 [Ahaetulla prasina]XP_058045879.1 probable methyltransferase-like protein 25 [Ahaetulla prasina]